MSNPPTSRRPALSNAAAHRPIVRVRQTGDRYHAALIVPDPAIAAASRLTSELQAEVRGSGVDRPPHGWHASNKSTIRPSLADDGCPTLRQLTLDDEAEAPAHSSPPSTALRLSALPTKETKMNACQLYELALSGVSQNVVDDHVVASSSLS